MRYLLHICAVLLVSCTIKHDIVFDSHVTDPISFPGGFNCPLDGGTTNRFIESALVAADGGKNRLLSFTLVSDFISIKGAATGAAVEGACQNSYKSKESNCNLLPKYRTCLPVDTLPVEYLPNSGVFVPADGGLSGVLHERGWNLTANAQPPDSDVFVRIVALQGVTCDQIPTGVMVKQDDFYNALSAHVVGCIYSQSINLHSSSSNLVVELPADKPSECACSIQQCTSIFHTPICDPPDFAMPRDSAK